MPSPFRIVPALVLPLVLFAASARAAVVPREALPAIPFAGTPEAAARAALDSTRVVRLPEGSTLHLVSSSRAGPAGGHIVRFEQRHRGVRVQDAIVAVRLDAAGRALRVVSSLVALADVPEKAAVPLKDAVRLARAATPIPQPREEGGRASLLVTRSGRLAYAVRIPALLVHQSAIEAIVDATTGEILSIVDHSKHADANVFESAKAAQEARRSDSTLDVSALVRRPVTGLASTAAGATLNEQADGAAGIIGYNCCANEGCDGRSPPKMNAGQLAVGNFNISFSAAMCDERQTSLADANGDHLHVPPREPRGNDSTGAPIDPVPSDCDGDVFAEVQAYDGARRMLDYMQRLDPQFRLRTEARPLRITSNFMIPKLSEAVDNFDLETFSTTVRTLERVDNAAYVPAGAGEQLGVALPGFDREFDSILMFQGTRSDFAYDRDVVAHELSHGTVAATGGLANYAADGQGIVDAPGAMNEGFADFWAAALANDPVIGEYAGDLTGRGEGSIRNLTNEESCPSVIVNEVHVDSQHFSAALWALRVDLATNEALKLAFDTAILTAMRGLSPISTFDDAAEVITDELEDAFPAAGRDAIETAFRSRGVTECERILDLDPATPSKSFAIAGRDNARGWRNVAPGPLQFRLSLPAGAKSVRITAIGGASQGIAGIELPFGGGGDDEPNLQAFFKMESPVGFAYSASRVSDDADDDEEFTASGGGDPIVLFEFDPDCEKTAYVALGNLGTNDWRVEELKVRYAIDADMAEACKPVVVDAGTSPDGGAGGGSDIGGGGCGCGGAGAVMLLPGALLLRRRRRS